MNCNNENDGPLPTLSQSSSLDVLSGSVEKAVCRKYVWGTCTKQAQCKFRHELNIDEMRKILKFCHDHQNKRGCTRENCTYLHTTKEEENLFRASGQIPRVLAERHAAMGTAANMTNAETIPQIAMFIKSFRSPSQPPPPPPVTTAAVVSTAVGVPTQGATAPPPPPPPRPAPALSVAPNHLIQQPPPPPPPAANYNSTNGPLPQNCPLSRPPPTLPTGFDASRPPPVLPPTRIQPGTSSQNAPKHKLPKLNDAGANKLRKPDDTNPAEDPCYNCTQAELRIELYKQEAERLQSKDEYQSLMIKKKQKAYEMGKMILKSLVGPEMFRILEDYIEAPQVDIDDILEQQNQRSLVSSRNIVLDLLESLAGSSTRSFVTPTPPLSDPLPPLPRRLSPKTRSSSDLLNIVMELIRDANIGNERQQLDDRVSDIENNRLSSPNNRLNGNSLSVNTNLFASSSTAPGYYSNPLVANTSAVPVKKSSASSVSASNPPVNVTATSRNEHSMPGTSGQSLDGFSAAGSYPVRVVGPSLPVAGPSELNNVTSAASTFRGPTAAPPFVPTFHPSVPPPINRPIYPFPSNVNNTQNSPNRMPGTLQHPLPVRPPPGVPHPPNYNNMMVRYPPHPSFYPPYQ